MSKDKNRMNRETIDVTNHIAQSDKALKNSIASLFEFAKGEPVTVHVIQDKKEDAVHIEIRSTDENKTLLFQESYDVADTRLYPLKVNSVLHMLLSSSLTTILDSLQVPQD